jgi:hypothetical protein
MITLYLQRYQEFDFLLKGENKENVRNIDKQGNEPKSVDALYVCREVD